MLLFGVNNMFKKMRKFYKNNRIYCILMIISIFCIILMGASVIIYFINQSNTNPYGTRLEGIEKHELGSTLADLESFYKEQAGVKSVSARLQGKIIYVSVTVEDTIKNEEIQNMATSCLEKISDENKAFYDVQFIFTRPSYTPYFGSKISTNTMITWTNYSYDTETTTTTKK